MNQHDSHEDGMRARAPWRLMLKWGTVGAVVGTVGAVVVSGAQAGLSGVWGALAGGMLALVFFAGGLLALEHMLRAWAAGLALTAALVVYTCQLLTAMTIAFLISAVAAVDQGSVGVGIMAAAGLWVIGQIWGFSRARILVFGTPTPEPSR